jgi:hypothetical protein
MSETDGQPSLRAIVVVAAMLVAIPIVVIFDPLGAIVGAIPWPDLPFPDVGGLPGWAKWMWRALMVSLLALAVIEALREGRASGRSEPGEKRPE